MGGRRKSTCTTPTKRETSFHDMRGRRKSTCTSSTKRETSFHDMRGRRKSTCTSPTKRETSFHDMRTRRQSVCQSPTRNEMSFELKLQILDNEEDLILKLEKLKNIYKLERPKDIVVQKVIDACITEYHLKIPESPPEKTTVDIFKPRLIVKNTYSGKKESIERKTVEPVVFKGEIVAAPTVCKQPFVRDWLLAPDNKFSAGTDMDTQQKNYEELLPSKYLENILSADKQSDDRIEPVLNRSADTVMRDSTNVEVESKTVSHNEKLEHKATGKKFSENENVTNSEKVKLFFDKISKKRKGNHKEEKGGVAWKKVKQMKKDLKDPSKASSKLDISIETHKKNEDTLVKLDSSKSSTPLPHLTLYDIIETSNSGQIISDYCEDLLRKDRLGCQKAIIESKIDASNTDISKVSHPRKKLVPFLKRSRLSSPIKKQIKPDVAILLNFAGDANYNICLPERYTDNVSVQTDILNLKDKSVQTDRHAKDVSVQANISDVQNISAQKSAKSQSQSKERDKSRSRRNDDVEMGNFSQDIDMFEVDETENRENEPTSNSAGSKLASGEATAGRKTRTATPKSQRRSQKAISQDVSASGGRSKPTTQTGPRYESESLFATMDQNPAFTLEIHEPQRGSGAGVCTNRTISSRKSTPERINKAINDEIDDYSVDETPHKQVANVKRLTRRQSTIFNNLRSGKVVADDVGENILDPASYKVETPLELNQFAENVQHRSTPVEPSARKSLSFDWRRQSVGGETPPSHRPSPSLSIMSDSLISKTIVKPSEKVPVVMMSMLLANERTKLMLLVERMKWSFVEKYTRDVTHLVIQVENNRASRSLKYLHAVAAKKWVVASDWVDACLEHNRQVDEEPFEALDESGIAGPRKSRQSKEKIFNNISFYCLQYRRIQRDDLKIIIEDAGGTLLTDWNLASVFDSTCLPIAFVDPDDSEKDFSELVVTCKLLPVKIEWLIHGIGTQEIQSIRRHLMCTESVLPSDRSVLSQAYD